jgi:Fe-S cluster assembly iron-binding protein IscA
MAMLALRQSIRCGCGAPLLTSMVRLTATRKAAPHGSRLLSAARMARAAAVAVPHIQHTTRQQRAMGTQAEAQQAATADALGVDSPLSLDDSVIITIACARRIKQLAQQKHTDKLRLRLSVEGGGCSGFQYTFSMDDSADASQDAVDENAPKDIVFERDGAKVYSIANYNTGTCLLLVSTSNAVMLTVHCSVKRTAERYASAAIDCCYLTFCTTVYCCAACCNRL